MKVGRILIALAGSAVDPDVISLTAAIAKPAKAKTSAVHIIEVRWNLPLDAVLDADIARGEDILHHGEAIARKLGIELETELLQAREAAAAIVDTAVERKSDLVVLGMPYRKRMGRVYVARTVQNVYLRAPCAVLAYRQEQP
ncbi:MAG: universal stress protein [Chloroflexota bacterium]|nr:universal stress protein [Chloroflexota bacterium]